MTSIPPSIAAETALLKQNVALSVIKQSAEQDRAIVNILDQASRSAPINETRGSNINIQV